MASPLFFTFYFIFITSSIRSSIAISTNTLNSTQELYDGRTLVSSNQRFELGFFNLSKSSYRYLGIWYKNLPFTVVWMANRNNPITGNSSSLKLNPDGELVLYNGTMRVWVATDMNVPVKGKILQLLNNGNLVMKHSNDSEDYIWESFNYPSDTLLPDMKLGWNLTTGFHWNLTSWISSDDPSEGEFSFSLDPPDSPQLVLRKGSEKQYRWGPWDGVRFSGSNKFKSNPVFTPVFFYSDEEVYYTYKMGDDSIISRFVVTHEGIIQYLLWRDHSNGWVNMVTLQRDNCDRYKLCGPYGNCYDEDPNCRCLKGFEPKSPDDWKLVDWSGGCSRKWVLECGNGDGFVKYRGLKLPDNSRVWGNTSVSLGECEAQCLKNCSCRAYTKINVHGRGSQCVLWFDDLVDMRNYPDGGEELYIRMAAQELESISRSKRKRRVTKIAAIVITTAVVVLLCCFGGRYILGILRAKRKAEIIKNAHKDSEVEGQDEDLELPLFDLETISAATNKFSFKNQIGEGGFGSVYKGELPFGHEIAVKRLSQTSGQGVLEFKTEVILIKKLQHRNLVKLLGCCIQGEERMLIYEYLPNKSLDNFIFDPTKKPVLTWKKRFDIVMGIARGLLYLHQDSRLRIIHRDLKTSNILLDSEMNPKISDFGIARIFGGDQTEEKTKRVMGTYGYMSPEYAMNGHFSVKSDVYSFGVIVLEIISSQKNRGFHHHGHDLNLLGHAWKLWNEGNPLKLIDAQMDDSVDLDEVVRCIQVGLLCVQQRPEDRPTMSTVVFMLGSEGTFVPEPKEPGFCSETSPMGSGISSLSSGQNLYTPNEVTLTSLKGR